MSIRISALARVPDFAKGFVKDLRVRWALEEAGLAYETVLLDPDSPREGRDLEWQPFGQVPAYRDDGIEIFESGAIVLFIASRSPALAPPDPRGQARVASWVFAATTSVQPFVDNHGFLRPHLPDSKRHLIDDRLRRRLGALERRLHGRDYLEKGFSAGDLVMACVVREVDEGTMQTFPVLTDYLARCQARPAFKRALEAQLADFSDECAAETTEAALSAEP